MGRIDPFYRQDAEDCIRMMRFMSRSVMEEMKTIENCVKVYKKMYPDWETEDEKEHYFFYDVSFIDDAIKEYSTWLKIAADRWEEKINGISESQAGGGR